MIDAEPRPKHKNFLAAGGLNFEGQLEHIRKANIVELPNISNDLEHLGRITNFDPKYLDPGMYLSSKFSEEATTHGPPDRFSFESQDLLSVGRDNSRRGVFFGTMTMEWFNGDEVSQQVAIKPASERHIPDFQKSLQEIAMYQYLPELSLRTFDVLGALVVQEDVRAEFPKLYMVTEFDPDVVTMDNFDWQSLSVTERWERAGLAIEAAAELHSKLTFHGDLVRRNIGINQTGDVVMLDLEEAESARDLAINPHDERAQTRIRQCMSNDLTTLIHDLEQVIYYGRPKLSSIERFEEINTLFFNPYYSHLMHSQSDYLPILKEQLTIILGNRGKEANGEQPEFY